MGIYGLLGVLKGKLGYQAVAAFMLHLGILSLSIKKKQLAQSIENKKRLNVAFENYGLK